MNTPLVIMIAGKGIFTQLITLNNDFKNLDLIWISFRSKSNEKRYSLWLSYPMKCEEFPLSLPLILWPKLIIIHFGHFFTPSCPGENEIQYV